eukprot:389276-Alexandrium_andersonii.AAC.1
MKHLALDVMHILDLGVTQFLVGSVFRRLLDNNFCKSKQAFAKLKFRDNLRHLRRRMRAYYASQSIPRGHMSAIGKLTEKMLSSKDVPRLKAKAAETRNLVPLCVQLVSEHPRKLGQGAALLKAATEQLDL